MRNPLSPWVVLGAALTSCTSSRAPSSTPSAPSSPSVASAPVSGGAEEEEKESDGEDEGGGPMLATAIPGPARRPPACAPDLTSCAADGCERPGSARALFNRMKRQDVAGVTFESATTVTVHTLELLQAKARVLVGEKRPLTAEQRRSLASLTILSQTLGEGSAVRIAGYIAPRGASATSGAHEGGVESVNCRLSKPEERDIHIPLTASATGETECDGVVVEMIPQGRAGHPAWTTPSLQRLAKARTLVMVVGRLLYDNEHEPRADCAVKSDEPKRLSLWEVHPVAELYACEHDRACTPDKKEGWRKVD